jgi:hypothetical protein
MGWTVWRSNPGGGEIFRTCPDRPWRTPSLLYNGYRVFPGSKKRPGLDTDPSPPSSAVGHKRVELYLYSLYGPYGLYTASVPVQGCTLHRYLQISNRLFIISHIFAVNNSKRSQQSRKNKGTKLIVIYER